MRSELTGADAFLRAVEQLMAASGQGAHYGVSCLKAGPGFDLQSFRSAVQRLECASPIACARILQRPFSIPKWEWEPDQSAHFPVEVHDAGCDAEALAHARLNAADLFGLRFDIVPEHSGNTLVMATWRHLLLDGKGAELMLSELCRLSANPEAETQKCSWGPTRSPRLNWRESLNKAEQFKDHFYANAKLSIASLSQHHPRPGAARFHIERFSAQEVERIKSRAQAVSRDLFFLPLFLAAAIRAHRSVWLERGGEPESYQASCAVQLRKPGAHGPIWQNHVSQLFFCVPSRETETLSEIVESLQKQFSLLSKSRMQTAFVLMTNLFRRMPVSWYLRFIKSHSAGQLTSFFYSYTGKFLPGECHIAGARILDGWHIPSVPAPPGTGLFFSEFNGSLVATFSWRDGVISELEKELILSTLRLELLGE